MKDFINEEIISLSEEEFKVSLENADSFTDKVMETSIVEENKENNN